MNVPDGMGGASALSMFSIVPLIAIGIFALDYAHDARQPWKRVLYYVAAIGIGWGCVGALLEVDPWSLWLRWK